jgi:hypothetical protein
MVMSGRSGMVSCGVYVSSITSGMRRKNSVEVMSLALALMATHRSQPPGLHYTLR